MRKPAAILISFLLLLTFSLPSAAAATLTTEQKFEVLKQHGIMIGLSDGDPRLNVPMTREQLAQVLTKLLDLPVSPSVKPSYSDVLKTRWSFEEIQAVSAAKLMVGTAPRTFEPAARLTVEQLAATLVRAYGTPNGVSKVSGKVSSWARTQVGAALASGIVSPRSDYTATALRADLVNSVYVVFAAMNVPELNIQSVEPLSNESLLLRLSQRWSGTPNASWFIIRDEAEHTVPVSQAQLSGDGLSIVLSTGAQLPNVKHTLFLDGKSWTYTSKSTDATKPQVTGLERTGVRTYQLSFSEPLDAASATNPANYTLSGGLKLSTLQLSADKTRVTFTTTTQTDGVRYTLTVRNVKDASGNVMDTRSDLTFTGSRDDVKPKVLSVQILPSATLVVKFSEKVNPQIAVQTQRYAIDKGVAVIKATIDDEGKTITLMTTAQKDATVYSLTVSGIPDLTGNVMETTTGLLFGGIANPVLPVKLQNVTAINENTLEVVFDRGITDNDIKSLNVAVLTDNGANVSMTGWSKYVQRKVGSGTERVATVQFRTSGDGSPNLFRAGHVYFARVTGVVSLEVKDNANVASFGGTEAVNAAPAVTQVAATSRTTVRVIFSEPVNNIATSAFVIKEQDGTVVAVASNSVNGAGAVVTEVVLKLAADLVPGKVYTMTFKPGVTDAAGWNGLVIKNGNADVSFSFTGL